MNAKTVGVVPLAVLLALAGCKNQSQQAATTSAPAVVQAAPPASAADTPRPSDLEARHENVVAVTEVLTPEASQALAFVNRRFVASDCTLREGSTWTICSHNGVLSIAGDKLITAHDFEEHYSNGSVKYSHEAETVAISDLDADSLKVQDNDFEGGTDEIYINCKNGKKCTSAIETSSSENPKQFSDNRLTVGDFSRKDVKEVGSYLKRLLALQQGKVATAIEHEPSEAEALAFLNAHYAPSISVGGITAVHRSLTVEGDEFVEAEDLMQYGQPSGRLVVRVNLKDLDELLVPDDRGIGLVCKASSERGIPNCFSANTGQSSSDHVIMGVANPEEFSKMLKRLIVLHSSFGASQTVADAPAESEASVLAAVDGWASAFRSKDSNAMSNCYAPLVEKYFLQNNVTREQVRRYEESAFARTLDIHKYEIGDVQVKFLPQDQNSTADFVVYSRAVATFHKEWETTEAGGKTFSGAEIEQLTFISSPEGWKIIREEEQKIIRASRM